MRVAIVLFDGFDELDAIGPFEVLQVELVTLEGAEEVTGQHGLRVRPTATLEGRPDLLIVPGGGWNARAAKGAWGEAQRGELPTAIARLYAAGTVVATVCTGGMLAATAGIAKGRPAITHYRALGELRAAGAEVISARVVDDGDLISAGGVTSGLDLALWLVERYFGAAAASAVAGNLEYERRGRIWRRNVPDPA